MTLTLNARIKYTSELVDALNDKMARVGSDTRVTMQMLEVTGAELVHYIMTIPEVVAEVAEVTEPEVEVPEVVAEDTEVIELEETGHEQLWGYDEIRQYHQGIQAQEVTDDMKAEVMVHAEDDMTFHELYERVRNSMCLIQMHATILQLVNEGELDTYNLQDGRFEEPAHIRHGIAQFAGGPIYFISL